MPISSTHPPTPTSPPRSSPPLVASHTAQSEVTTCLLSQCVLPPLCALYWVVTYLLMFLSCCQPTRSFSTGTCSSAFQTSHRALVTLVRGQSGATENSSWGCVSPQPWARISNRITKPSEKHRPCRNTVVCSKGKSLWRSFTHS